MEDHLARRGENLGCRANAPRSIGYRPETDISSELCATDAAYFQSLSGVLRWIFELNIVDITMENSCFGIHDGSSKNWSSHTVVPYDFFPATVFDPTPPDIDEFEFTDEAWTSTVYGDCKEEIPSYAPFIGSLRNKPSLRLPHLVLSL